MLKMQPEMTQAIKINHFYAILRKKALQTSRKIIASSKKTLDDVLIVFRRKYVKPESQATATHKWHKLTFDPNTKSLSNFLGELNECAEGAFGDNAQHMIDSLLYAKLPLRLKQSLNLAYLANWQIKPDYCASRKIIRSRWFRKRRGADNTHKDSRTPK